MGELRDSIVNLGKQLATAAKAGDALATELDAVDQRAVKNLERLEAGADVLWTYLEALFDRNGRKLNDHLRDKLSEHSDTEIVTYLRGIDSAANEVLQVIGEYSTLKAKMPAEYGRIDTLAAQIKKNIDKKRAKLIQSKKYKTKLAGYEKALGEVTAAVADRRKAWDKLGTISARAVEELRIKPTATIAEVKQTCTLSVQQGLTQMKQAVEQGTWVSRKFRENGDLKAAFEQMKDWAGEADSMDQEVVNLDPNAVKPIEDVEIHFASKLVGKAPKAVFQGKRPMEIKSLTWAKGVDFTKLLQKTITVRAKYINGAGEFGHDMKVTGASANTVKLG